MKSTPSSLTPHRIASYCDLKLVPVLEPEEVSTVREYLMGLLERNEYPPYRGSGLDLKALANQLGVSLLAAMWLYRAVAVMASRQAEHLRWCPGHVAARSTGSWSPY